MISTTSLGKYVATIDSWSNPKYYCLRDALEIEAVGAEIRK